MANLKVNTNRLRRGMVIKSDVFTNTGVVIVPEGTEVTKDVVDLLTKHFIEEVIVEYNGGLQKPAGINLEEKVERVSEQQMQEFKESFQVAEDTLSESLKSIAYQDKDIDIQGLLGMVNSVLEKSDNDVNLCDMLFRMKQSAENLYTHSINVSLFAQILAKWAGFTREEVELVAVAGLLHDIGILKCQQESPRSFTFRDEWEKKCFDKHVVYGYNTIKDKDIDARVKQAVLTHHERMDQSGFPLGIPYTSVNNISRVLAIADTYDTLTMEEEGKEVLSPFETLKYLQDKAYGKFDSRLLMTFIERIAQTFIQYDVVLSNGQQGKIVMINKFDLTRPLVQVGESFINLAMRKDITIKKVLS